MSALRRLGRRLAPSPITDWNHKRVGMASLAVVLAVVVSALVLTSSIFGSAYTVKARFTNAVGLNDGAQVLLAGVAVGKVTGLEVQGDHVLVTMAINDGTQVPADSTANISVATLLGVVAVTIQPGGDWAHLLHGGSTITDTSVPFQFFEVQNSAGHLLTNTDAGALGQLVSSLSQATSGDRGQIRQVISGLSKLTGVVDSHRAQAGQLIDAVEALSATLASKDSQLSTVVDDLDQVVSGLADRSGELGQLIDATEQAATQTSSLVGRNQPKLQELLTSLHAALQTLGSHQLDVARSVAFAASAIKGFSSIAQSGSTTPQWANIYADIVGSAVADEVLGPCGALDEALNVALGPDPLPCDKRTGPIPAGGAGSGSTSPSPGTGSGSSAPSGSLPSSSGVPPTSSPVSSLYQPLTGGRS